MSNLGQIVVVGQGMAEFFIPFKPDQITANFVAIGEDDIPDSIQMPACELSKPDTVKTKSFYYEDMMQWVMVIEWQVSRPRRIKWQIAKVFSGEI